MISTRIVGNNLVIFDDEGNPVFSVGPSPTGKNQAKFRRGRKPKQVKDRVGTAKS